MARSRRGNQDIPSEEANLIVAPSEGPITRAGAKLGAGLGM
ncbi:hypothetical protein [Sinomonas sp.]